jgi:fucose permease
MVIVLWGNILLTVLDTALAVELNEQYGMSATTIGLIFGMQTGAYTIGSIATGFLQEKLPKEWIAACGNAIAGVGVLLISGCT